MDDLIRVILTIDPSDPWTDVLSYRLMESGFLGVQNEDQRILAYIVKNEFDQQWIDDLIKEFDQINIQTEVESLPPTNWNAVWESNYDPVYIGSDVCIYAHFHEEPQGIKYPIKLTPKMSFGTGHHATTRLMMEEMLKMNFQDLDVFDVGCGSGILAILAEKMGAKKVDAIDIDDWCIENSKENVEGNQCTTINVEKTTVADMRKHSYNIILANINRNIIVNDLPKYNEFLAPGGELMLSGFLKSDKSDILNTCHELDLEEIGAAHQDDWMLLKLHKPA